jgi:acyl-CoA hydrolase
VNKLAKDITVAQIRRSKIPSEVNKMGMAYGGAMLKAFG